MNAKEKNIREEILNLQKKIAEWDNAYYNLDNPIVTDEIYDTEFIRLQKLEKQYSHLLTYEEVKNSPTQKIDAKSLSIFDKVIHKKPMLSLNKAYSIEEIKKFIKNIEKYTNDFSFFIEPKIDGLSISLTYENGKLIRGVTRGDGITGEDVTKNILQINDIPKEIEYKHKIELRGEIYLSISCVSLFFWFIIAIIELWRIWEIYANAETLWLLIFEVFLWSKLWMYFQVL